MDNNIKNKVIIITGASSGIGEVLAKKLGEQGGKLVLAARRANRLEELVKAIRENGGTAVYHITDVRDKNQVKELKDFTLQSFGRIDVLVNNAGVMPTSFLENNATDEWDRLIDINIKGVLYCIGAVLHQMREQKSGHIVNVSSNAAYDAINPYSTVYNMTKHAVRNISEGLRAEEAMKGSNIRVTEICHGSIDTELINTVVDPEMQEVAKMLFSDKTKMLTAEEMADAIVFAINEPENVLIRTLVVQPTKA